MQSKKYSSVKMIIERANNIVKGSPYGEVIQFPTLISNGVSVPSIIRGVVESTDDGSV